MFVYLCNKKNNPLPSPLLKQRRRGEVFFFICTLAYWLIGTSASAQTFYNNVQHCDTCLTYFYADGMFNHNQQLIATGMEHYSNSTTLFLDQYISNTSNFLRHKYIDTNYYLGLQLLQNNNKTYNIFSSTQQDTGTNWNGIHSN